MANTLVVRGQKGRTPPPRATENHKAQTKDARGIERSAPLASFIRNSLRSNVRANVGDGAARRLRAALDFLIS